MKRQVAKRNIIIHIGKAYFYYSWCFFLINWIMIMIYFSTLFTYQIIKFQFVPKNKRHEMKLKFLSFISSRFFIGTNWNLADKKKWNGTEWGQNKFSCDYLSVVLQQRIHIRWNSKEKYVFFFEYLSLKTIK